MTLHPIRSQLRKLISLPIVDGFDKKLLRKFISWLYPLDPAEDWHFEGIIPYGEDMLIAVDTTNWPGWNIFCFGFYSKHLDTIFSSIVADGDIVFDVGANIGDTTLLLAKQTGRMGKVYAFEPLPVVNRILRFNSTLNGMEQIRIFDYALADSEGQATLQYPTPGKTFSPMVGRSGITGSASLGDFDRTDAPDCPLQSITVECTTLDTVAHSENIESLRLIKIDVEGFDCRVIEGARNTIRKFRPFIIFEYNHHWERRGGRKLRDALAVLEDYTLYGMVSRGRRSFQKIVDPNSFKGGDILAVPLSDQELQS